jgi:hypothetical protein
MAELKKFKTEQEIITDDYFIQFVRENIEEMHKSYRNRKPAPVGMRYKKGAFEQLESEGNFNSYFFISNIIDIWNKKSNLNSLQRNMILNVCTTAFRKTLIEYQKIYLQELNKNSKNQ